MTQGSIHYIILFSDSNNGKRDKEEGQGKRTPTANPFKAFFNPTFNVKFKIQSPEIDLLITPVKAQGDGAFLRN